MISPRPFVVSLALGLALVGCNSGEPRVQKSFEKPRMPSVPHAVETTLDPHLQKQAADEIAVALGSTDPVTRAQAFEAMSRTHDPAAGERVVQGMADRDWRVRFAAALCSGELRLTGAYRAVAKAAFEDNPNVRVASRYALFRMGDFSLTKDLEAMSQNADPRVRANVAMVLGLMKEPTGVLLLRPMIGDADDAVRLAAAEALWALGDNQGLRNLRAGTISPYPDEQIVCTLALARPRDPQVKESILGKLAIDKDGKQYVELQLAAARALGLLKDDAGYGVAERATRSGDARQRVMAAFALGDIGRLDAQPALAKLLADSKAEVRLAAATAIRQLAENGATADAR